MGAENEVTVPAAPEPQPAPADGPQTRRPLSRRTSNVLMVLVAAAAFGLYAQGLDIPNEGMREVNDTDPMRHANPLYWDENYYVFIAHRQAQGQWKDPCWGERPMRWDHPPVAKLILTASVAMFDREVGQFNGCLREGDTEQYGYVCYTDLAGRNYTTGRGCFTAFTDDMRTHGNPWAWRLPSALMGTLAVACTALTARKLLGSTGAGVLAGSFLMMDGVFFAASRMATLDIFATGLAALAIYCATFANWKGRVLAGLALGLAFSSKNTAFMAGLPVLLVLLWSHHRAGKLTWRTGTMGAACVILLPGLVWVVSYLPWWAIWIRGHGIAGAIDQWVDVQKATREWDSYSPKPPHPEAAQPHEWFKLQRPMFFFTAWPSADRALFIYSIPNPILWWGAALAGIAGLFHTARLFLRPAPPAQQTAQTSPTPTAPAALEISPSGQTAHSEAMVAPAPPAPLEPPAPTAETPTLGQAAETAIKPVQPLAPLAHLAPAPANPAPASPDPTKPPRARTDAHAPVTRAAACAAGAAFTLTGVALLFASIDMFQARPGGPDMDTTGLQTLLLAAGAIGFGIAVVAAAWRWRAGAVPDLRLAALGLCALLATTGILTFLGRTWLGIAPDATSDLRGTALLAAGALGGAATFLWSQPAKRRTARWLALAAGLASWVPFLAAYLATGDVRSSGATSLLGVGPDLFSAVALLAAGAAPSAALLRGLRQPVAFLVAIAGAASAVVLAIPGAALLELLFDAQTVLTDAFDTGMVMGLFVTTMALALVAFVAAGVATALAAALFGLSRLAGTSTQRAVALALLLLPLCYSSYFILVLQSFIYYFCVGIPFLALALAAYIWHWRNRPEAFGWLGGGIFAILFAMALYSLGHPELRPGTIYVVGMTWAGLVGVAGLFGWAYPQWERHAARAAMVLFVGLMFAAFAHYWPVLEGLPIGDEAKESIVHTLPWVNK